VQVHLFDGYWEDIGTIKSFYESNLDLARSDPPFELASQTQPIYSRPRFLPPTRIDGASIRQSLIADGCQIEPDATIENSVIGLRCHIGRNVTIRNSVIMGADAYELRGAGENARPKIGIGEGTTIEGAIVDKNSRIGRDVHIASHDGAADRDISDCCVLRDGIVVVEKDGLLPDGWRLN
jgi:glucose-1-phosphate adenylyltransferase